MILEGKKEEWKRTLDEQSENLLLLNCILKPAYALITHRNSPPLSLLTLLLSHSKLLLILIIYENSICEQFETIT